MTKRDLIKLLEPYDDDANIGAAYWEECTKEILGVVPPTKKQREENDFTVLIDLG